MATTTFTCNKDARIADSGTSLGAGASDFNPVGLYSGYLYRTLLGFSYSFSGMVSITSAILHVRTSTQYYVAFGSDPDVNVRRLSASWSEGTAVSLSGSNAVEWSNQPGTTGTIHTFDVSTAESTWDTCNITTLMQEALAAGVFYGLKLYAVDEGAASDVTEFYSREQGSSDPYIEVTYTTNVGPNAPINLAPTGGGIVAGGTTPVISFTHSDNDGDALLDYDLQVSTDSTFASVTHWNIAAQTTGIVGNDVDRTYAGTALTRGTTYYWRARTSSAAGVLTEGPWSAAQSFKVNQLPTVTFVTPSAADALIEMTKTAGSGVNPRMVVRWSFSDPDGGAQQKYRVVVETDALGAFYDSGTVTSSATSLTIPVDPTRGAYYRVEVTVTDANNETGSAGPRRCKAQWTVAEYRIDLGGTVTAWSTSATSSGGTNKLVVTEYASSATGTAITTWYSSLASAALARWFHWRVFLFAWSGATTPSMDKMAITYTSSVGVPPDGWTMGAQFALDTGTKVYGTQSLRGTTSGTSYYGATQVVPVERNTEYILSGRMKSDGNTNAHIKTTVGGVQYFSATQAAATDWERVQTPVFNSGENDTVTITCILGGPSCVSGTKAWYDALKLEASTVVTPWTPGFVGAGMSVDAGGLQIDASPVGGAVMRLQAATGGTRDRVELGANGLLFGGDVELYSGTANELQIKTTGASSKYTLLRMVGRSDSAATDYTGYLSMESGDSAARLFLGHGGDIPSGWTGLSLGDGTGSRDTNLYRNAANSLRTDDLFNAATSFPGGTPTTGLRIFRTDLGMEFFYNGTRWLSTTLYRADDRLGASAGATIPYTATTANGNSRITIPLMGGSDVWVEDAWCAFYVSGGTALSASHKWVATLTKNPSNTTLTTITIDSGSSSVWRNSTTAVNALLGSTDYEVDFLWTKTGTPGSLFQFTTILYRVVAT